MALLHWMPTAALLVTLQKSAEGLLFDSRVSEAPQFSQDKGLPYYQGNQFLQQQQVIDAPIQQVDQQMPSSTNSLGSFLQPSSAQVPSAQSFPGMLSQLVQSSLQSASSPSRGSPPEQSSMAQQLDQSTFQSMATQGTQGLTSLPQQLQNQPQTAQNLLSTPQQLDSPQASSSSLLESPQLAVGLQDQYTDTSMLQSTVASLQAQLASERSKEAKIKTNDASLLQSTVANLQTQLASEQSKEAKLASVVAQKQDEMRRLNASFGHISALAEASADEERQLQTQLANSTAVNQALRVELAKIQDDDNQKAKELFDEQAKVTKLQDKLRQADEVKGQALHIMKDVRLAQEKVRRTEDIIRGLVPMLSQATPLQQTQQQGYSSQDGFLK